MTSTVAASTNSTKASLPRIVLGKVGLDGHDRGIKVVARALRDAGFEVIYAGLGNSPEQIVHTAIQEDAAGLGLSILSGAHMTLFPAVLDLLKRSQAADIIVFGGGIMPPEDIDKLESAGVAKIFTPGTPISELIAWATTSISG